MTSTRYSSHPLSVRKASTRASRALGAQLVEVVMPLPSSALQLLSPADKARGKLSQEKHRRGRDEGRGNSKIQQKKCVPGKPATQDLRGSAAPHSACC
jgi:hypothetical protein